VGALTGNAHGGGDVGDRTSRLDAPAQQESTSGRKGSVTVGHEDLREGVLDSSSAHLLPEVFHLVDAARVNNVREKYT
jgi:hypothetical protein